MRGAPSAWLSQLLTHPVHICVRKAEGRRIPLRFTRVVDKPAVTDGYEAVSHHPWMPTSERTTDRAARRARRFLVAMGEEVRRGRAEAGVSQRALGAIVGISQSQVARTEAGENEALNLVLAAQLLAAVGRDLSANVYRGGAPVRDTPQLKLLERLRGRVPPGLRFRTEVPLALPGDQRAWDAVVDGPGILVAFECYSRLEDAQATERVVNLKQRDAGVPCVVLVLKESRHNRAALAGAPDVRRAFPLGARAIFSALHYGRQPPTNGLMFL